MSEEPYVRNPFASWASFAPERFSGHVRRVQTMLDILTDDEPRAVNLVGPRWIGKTAILKFLAHRGAGALTRPEYRAVLESKAIPFQPLPIYVDMAAEFDPGNPFRALTEILAAEIKDQPGIDLRRMASQVSLGQDPSGLDRVKTEQRTLGLATAAVGAGLRLIVCIDHSDQARALADEASVRQIERLASLASVVLATRDPLQDIFPDLAGSPFVHRLLVERVRLLDKAEALDLLSPPWPDGGPRLDAQDKELLIDHVGRQPYLLLRAAWQAYEYLLASPPGTRLTPNYVWFEVAPALGLSFEHLWRESAPGLQAFFRIVSGGAAPGIGVEKSLQRLQHEGLIYEDPRAPGKYVFFSPLFEDHVRQKMSEETRTVAGAGAPGGDDRRVLEALGLDTGSKEGKLLHLLVSRAGQVVTDQEAQVLIWGARDKKHVLDTTVGRLRARLQGEAGTSLGKIVRHRNVGYSYE